MCVCSLLNAEGCHIRVWLTFGIHLKRPDFREGKSTELKCNKTIVDHITQIFSQIPHPYNDNIRVQIVQNYINYYITALAESKVTFIQNSLKIRSPNSSVGTNPSTSNSSELYSSAEPVCQNLSVRFVRPLPPYEHCFVEIGYKLDIIKKEPIKLGFPMY